MIWWYSPPPITTGQSQLIHRGDTVEAVDAHGHGRSITVHHIEGNQIYFTAFDEAYFPQYLPAARVEVEEFDDAPVERISRPGPLLERHKLKRPGQHDYG